MPNLDTHTADLKEIATAYVIQRESGTLNHSAFTAAIIAYQQRHPNVPRSEAALVINQLIEDLPQSVTLSQ